MLGLFPFTVLAVAGAAAAWWLVPMLPVHRQFLWPLVLAALGFPAIALLQRKGWACRFLPAQQLAALVGFLLVLDIGARLRQGGAILRAGGLAMLCLSGGFLIIGIRATLLDDRLTRAHWLGLPFARAIDELAAGEPWFVFSLSVWPAFPTTLLVNDRCSSRSAHQWRILGILKLAAGTPAQRARARELQQVAIRFVTEDLERYRPAIIAVRNAAKHPAGAPFLFLPFLLEDPTFRRMWQQYEIVRPIEGYDFYRRTK